MKNLKFLFALTVLVSCMASCGGRRDACPSVGEGTPNNINKVA